VFDSIKRYWGLYFFAFRFHAILKALNEPNTALFVDALSMVTFSFAWIDYHVRNLKINAEKYSA
jgi:hypothetical protein